MPHVTLSRDKLPQPLRFTLQAPAASSAVRVLVMKDSFKQRFHSRRRQGASVGVSSFSLASSLLSSLVAVLCALLNVLMLKDLGALCSTIAKNAAGTHQTKL